MNDATENNVTLCKDVECILLECHRDRPGVFAAGVTGELLSALAHKVAGQLGPLIAGRYVSSRYAMAQAAIAERDCAVCAAFTGQNHAELMRKFGLSRLLVYAILGRKRRGSSGID